MVPNFELLFMKHKTEKNRLNDSCLGCGVIFFTDDKFKK